MDNMERTMRELLKQAVLEKEDAVRLPLRFVLPCAQL